jgi:peptidyl-prolyl cis-trans isomerase C
LACCLLASLFTRASAQTAALVNGEAIPLDEVEAILKQRPLPFLKTSDAEYREMQLEALDMLVDDLVVQQFLRKNVPVPPTSQINKKLKELQAALKTQGKSYEEYCRESGQTDAQVRTNIINMLQRNSYIASHLTPAEVRKYFDDNRDLFEQTTVRASHILLRLLPNCGPVEQAAAERKLELVRQEIVANRITFADAAKKYSQCPSAPSGGDLGYFGRKGAVDEAFARAAFALPQGALSAVVRTEVGVHLIQVTER